MELVGVRCISETEGVVMEVGCARCRSSVELVDIEGMAWQVYGVGL